MPALHAFALLLVSATAVTVEDSSSCAVGASDVQVEVRPASSLIQREQPRREVRAAAHVASEALAPPAHAATEAVAEPVAKSAAVPEAVAEPVADEKIEQVAAPAEPASTPATSSKRVVTATAPAASQAAGDASTASSAASTPTSGATRAAPMARSAGSEPTGEVTAQTPTTGTTRTASTASSASVVSREEAVHATAVAATKAPAQTASTASSASMGSAGDLPEGLVKLGVELFGSKDKLDKVIQSSKEVKVSYIGIPMRLRLKNGDNAMTRLPEEGASDEYGIDSLLQEGATAHGMINIVDMGANYGVVPIALYKRYPGMVRGIVAEPIHSTYFFLRWNMWLNGVDDISGVQLGARGKKRVPGILAVHRAVAEPNKDMNVCWSPDNSMNAAMCDCKQPPFESLCLDVKSIGTEEMMSFFGKEGVDFLKMDCEGCERHSLPALKKMSNSDKLVKRLVGELHNVPGELEDMACKFNHQTWMTKVCGPPRGAGQELECDKSTRDKNCYVEVSWPTP